jgi:uncharacterized protein
VSPKPVVDVPAVDALADTERWLERAVIGLNLCPFAKAVHGKGQIRWVLCPARRRAALMKLLTDELTALGAADPRHIDTTLIVAPRLLPRFADFNDFLGECDGVLHMLGLQGRIQIAAFHPRWRFADAAPRDFAHHTNRSPHPTLHLLREASVARAVAAFPDAQAIWGRNVATLRALGPAGWRVLLGAPAQQAKKLR